MDEIVALAGAQGNFPNLKAIVIRVTQPGNSSLVTRWPTGPRVDRRSDYLCRVQSVKLFLFGF
jgi:hypothetical protein